MSDYLKALGAGSGLDVKNIVSTLVNADKAPKQGAIDTKKLQTDTHISGMAKLKSAMQTLQTAFSALDDNSEFNFSTLTNSDSSAIAAQLSSGVASLGQHSIEISALAKSTIRISNEQESQTADLSGSEATFAFTVGSGSTKTITLAASASSLDDLVTAINAENAGVTARVVQTGSSTFRLLMESDATGSDQDITINTDLYGIGVNGNKLQTAQNATVVYNGLTVSSSSNQMNSLIPGVNLNLLKTTSTNVVLGVSRDATKATTAIKNVVTAFNTFDQIVNELGSAKSKGELANDSIVRQIRTKVRNLLINESSVTGATINRLSDMGISIDRRGVFQVNDTTLQSALTSNFDEIKDYFSAGTDNQSAYSTSARGVAGDMVKMIDDYLGSSGAVTNRQLSDTKTLSKIASDQETLDEKGLRIEERYTKQFSTMNKILDEMKSLQKYMESQLEHLPFTSSK
jgi:flagellar hook-associated protein 2